ncbi:luc7-like protein 3 [Parasteatoda tepidariorum]|uniref:luc7-like protein 3 n=1 Tax=Parasteatoda tepidariorum TaxID=114398 RepID=UPI00077FA517|nr:luc7-like protein 3 [Parasteatoda tepidariorum]XP_015930531.1 luc7-like protein 3 [Parasteatoda tepidariorum]
MALFSAKQLLDELMGRDRDLGLEEKKNDFTWDGPDICKHFLVKFCPNDLFVNTKADLGACPKIHDERLKKEYEKSSRFQRMGYEDDFLRFCQSMLSDVEKRIRRARTRLALNSKESNINQPPQVKNSDDEKVNVLTERINALLVQVENLGCEGEVEEAQSIMKLCEQLKVEREALRKASEANHWFQTAEIAAAQEKQMEVCEVCGAFLIVGDAQQRVDDHLMGKQHVGYAKLKEAVDEILDNREKVRVEREKLREKEREERRKARGEEDKKREERRKRIEEERRETERHRDRSRRSRSRDRTHNRRHSHRSRSRDSHSHSKGKDKERSRRRSGSSERKWHRSRSRDSGHRDSRRSRSRSTDHKKDRRSRDHRKSSHENGEPPEKSSRSEEGSKGRHSSGD